MDLKNELVTHPVFGAGKVAAQEENRITIQFAKEIGMKQFVYPDAFKNFLTISNPNLEQSIQEDLSIKKQQIELQEQTD